MIRRFFRVERRGETVKIVIAGTCFFFAFFHCTSLAQSQAPVPDAVARAAFSQDECVQTRLQKAYEYQPVFDAKGTVIEYRRSQRNIEACYGLLYERYYVFDACANYSIDFNVACKSDWGYERKPLQIAVSHLNERAVAQLLSRGADAKNTHIVHSLHAEKCNSKQELARCRAILALLVRNGANLNDPQMSDGIDAVDPALKMAARSGRAVFIDLLLEAGADINAKGSGGCTALDEAVRNNYQPTISYLESRGGKRAITCKLTTASQSVVTTVATPFVFVFCILAGCRGR